MAKLFEKCKTYCDFSGPIQIFISWPFNVIKSIYLILYRNFFFKNIDDSNFALYGESNI